MKPILFNTEMVQTILEGKKTVTRRVLKLPNHVKQNENGLYTLFTEGTCYENQSFEEVKEYIKPPYAVGNILYVRESVFQGVGHSLNMSGEIEGVLTGDFEYFADGIHEKDHWKDKTQNVFMRRRPSIHMPKAAARQKEAECSHEWEKKKLIETKHTYTGLKIFVFKCKCKKCGKETILEYW